MSFRVHVARKDLAGALQTLARIVKRKQQADAVVSFVDGHLQIDLPGGTAGVAAQGEWDGEVRVPGRFLLAYARSLPAADPLPVEVRGDRLYLAGFSVRCMVQDAGAARVQLPLDPSMLDILRMLAQHSDDEIERSGLTPLAQKACARFHEIGISGSDFDCFVDEFLRRQGEP